jgi:hypothetical protein
MGENGLMVGKAIGGQSESNLLSCSGQSEEDGRYDSSGHVFSERLLTQAERKTDITHG